MPGLVPGLATGDHPRTRGVYVTWTLDEVERSGSSPHARGLRHRRGAQRRRDGIIPARAGFTGAPWPSSSSRWDHPRTRGVYPGPMTAPSARDGSSPHARGLLRTDSDTTRVGRIIPARAGFTLSCCSLLGLGGDHPRTRGVYAGQVRRRRDTPGSSPHARGLRPAYHPRPGRHGIIPARAGFTPRQKGPDPQRRDHPRTRGVYPSHATS